MESLTGRRQSEYIVDFEEGSATACILRQAEQRGARLVVVGAAGKQPLERALLGSTAEQVVRHAHGPVLVARPSAEFGSVLAATDLTEATAAVLEAAVAEAARRDAPLVAIHSLDVGHPAIAAIEPSVVLPAATLTALREACRETLVASLARFGAPRGTPIVVDGPPTASIPHVARELQADLLVVGTHARSALRRVFLGSVAQALIRRAPCSVLVVRVAS
jgi:nucleotide-binding universal stress UspA family protein